MTRAKVQGPHPDAERLNGFLLATLLTTAVFGTALGLLDASPATAAFPGANGKIAFHSNRDGGGGQGGAFSEIYVMNPDGSGQTRLTQNTAYDASPAWSPDGSKIAFSSTRDGDYEIYVMNADGSGQTRLTYYAGVDGSPAWSPGGSRIAFERMIEGRFDVFVMNADGSGQTQLTSHLAEDGSPAWSPDGSKIAFSSDRDSIFFQIWVMNADGSGQTRLTYNPGDDSDPNWSPDGSRIAFWRSVSEGNTRIHVMNADGSGTIQLTSGLGVDGHPVWSPDGSKIAFQSNRDGDMEIYVMNADGSGVTQLTFNPPGATPYDANDSLPDWQPIPSLSHEIEPSKFEQGDIVRATAELRVRNDENQIIDEVRPGYAGVIEGSPRIAQIDGVNYVLWKIEWKWKIDDNQRNVEMTEDERTKGWSAQDWLLRDDVYWVAKVITNEAGSYSEQEQIAVGWTVLNRLALKFEDDIQEVVADGYAPSWKRPPNEPIYHSIVELAENLVEGRIQDTTGRATHFFSPVSMPWEGDEDKFIERLRADFSRFDTGGGLHYVPLPSNIPKRVYFPSWAAKRECKSEVFTHACEADTHEWVGNLEGVLNDYFMFYSPKISKIVTAIESPGELRVYDSQGRVTGLVNGEMRNEIPRSEYYDGTVTISFPSGPYLYEVAGAGEGSYALTVNALARQKTITFAAVNIPTSANAIHQYTIDWTALSRGEEGVTVQVDSNSDGTFEQTLTADSELTHGEFMLQTATTISHVVINEFEQNPPSGGHQFVELFNPTSQSWDIGNWIIYTTHGDIESYIIPAGTVLPARGFWQVTFPGHFVDNEDSLVLLNAQGQRVDETPSLSDTAGDSRSWQRYPDGSTNWFFAPSTTGIINVPEYPFPAILAVILITTTLLLSRRRRKWATRA